MAARNVTMLASEKVTDVGSESNAGIHRNRHRKSYPITPNLNSWAVSLSPMPTPSQQIFPYLSAPLPTTPVPASHCSSQHPQ